MVWPSLRSPPGRTNKGSVEMKSTRAVNLSSSPKVLLCVHPVLPLLPASLPCPCPWEPRAEVSHLGNTIPSLPRGGSPSAPPWEAPAGSPGALGSQVTCRWCRSKSRGAGVSTRELISSAVPLIIIGETDHQHQGHSGRAGVPWLSLSSLRLDEGDLGKCRLT